MQGAEALTRLIAIADRRPVGEPMSPEDQQEFENDQVAISIAQAILNTMLPVARFRCFVRIESGREEGSEYTLCAVKIEEIIAGLFPLSQMSRKLYINLWEQRPTGADMLKAFQGSTAAGRGRSQFRKFLDELKQYSIPVVVN